MATLATPVRSGQFTATCHSKKHCEIASTGNEHVARKPQISVSGSPPFLLTGEAETQLVVYQPERVSVRFPPLKNGREMTISQVPLHLGSLKTRDLHRLLIDPSFISVNLRQFFSPRSVSGTRRGTGTTFWAFRVAAVPVK